MFWRTCMVVLCASCAAPATVPPRETAQPRQAPAPAAAAAPRELPVAGLEGQHGLGIAIAGDTLVVGAANRTVDGVEGAGQVVVYRKRGGRWTLTAEIASPAPAALASFGSTVALDGNRLAVGAGFASGPVWVFVRRAEEWLLESEIEPPKDDDGAELMAGFGYDMALAGDTLAIGAPHLNHEAPSGGVTPFAGAVLLYRYAGQRWRIDKRLSAPEPKPYQLFGASVALSGQRILVGAPFNDAWATASGETVAPAAYQTGMAFVFRRDTTLVARLSGERDREFFGNTVAIHDDTLLVAAPEARDGAGAVYVYGAEDGTRREVLRGARAKAYFGTRLALQAQSLAVSSAHGTQVYRRKGNRFVSDHLLKGPLALGLAASERELVVLGDDSARLYPLSEAR